MRHHLDHRMQSTGFPEDCGLKKTKQREQVFSILEQEEMPISAYELYQKYIAMEDAPRGLAVSTVYRVLSAFEEKGLVSSSRLPGSDTAVYELNRGHKHYAMCLGCHKLIPLEHCPFMHRILPDLNTDEFTVTGHKLELYGYCKDCKAEEKN